MASNKTRKIGQLNIGGDERGAYYTQSYWIDSTDKSSYELPLLYHDPATTSPYDFPADSFFFKWQFDARGDHWLLKVESAEEGWFQKDMLTTTEDARGKIHTKTIFFETVDRANYETSDLKHFGDATVAPFNMPENSHFKEWTFTLLGRQTSLKITACEYGHFIDEDFKTTEEPRGKSYSRIYYFNTTDRSTYENVLEYFGDATTSPFNFPAGSYFKSWQFVNIGLQTTLTVEAKEIGLFSDIEYATSGNQKGKLYRQTFYFNTTERATYENPIQFYSPANVSPYTFPVNSYFYEWKFTDIREQTILEVTAGDIGQFENFELKASGEFRGMTYQKSYYFLTSSIALYESKLKYFGDASVAPFNLPAGTYFKEWSFSNLGLYTVLRVTACEIGLFEDFSRITEATSLGKSYTQNFHFLTTDLSSYETPLVFYTNANVSPYYFPSGSYFKDWKFTNLGTYTMASVKACEIGYFEDLSLKEVAGTKGIQYSKAFYFPLSEKSTYESLLLYYSDAHIAPFDEFFPDGTYFSEWAFNDLGEYCLLKVTASQIGYFEDFDLRTTGSLQGDTYQKTFYFLTTERANYESKLIFFGDASVSPFDMPAGSYFKEWSFNRLGSYTILKVVSATIGIIGDFERKTTSDSKGLSYNQNFYFLTSNKSTYETKLIYLSDASVSPFNFPVGSYFQQWKFESYGLYTILSVVASEIKYFEDFELKQSTSVNGKTYSQNFYFALSAKSTYESTLSYLGDATVTPYGFPAGSYFKEWKFTQLGTYVLLNVVASEIGYFENFELKTVSEQRGKSYSKMFYIATSAIHTYELALKYYSTSQVSPFTDDSGYVFPASTYFREWEFNRLGTYSLLRVIVSEIGLFENFEMTTSGDLNGYTYTKSFYFPTTELATYESKLIYFTDASVSPFNFPSGAYFKEWKKNSLGDYTVLHVTCATIGMFVDFERKVTSDIKGKSYNQNFYVSVSEYTSLDTLMVYFTSASVSPFNFPSNTYFREWKSDSLGDYMLVNVTASEIGYFEDFSMKITSEATGNLYSKAFYFLTSNIATYQDVLEYHGDSQVYPFTSVFPVSTFFKQWNFVDLGTYTLLRLTCGDIGQFENFDLITTAEMNGNTYRKNFYFETTQISQYETDLKYFGDASVFPFNMPSGSYFKDWKFTKYGLYTLLSVTTADIGVFENFELKTSGDIKGNKYSKSFYFKTSEVGSYESVLEYAGDATVNPFNMPSGSFFYEWTFMPLGEYTLLRLTCADIGMFDDLEMKTISDQRGLIYQQSFRITQLERSTYETPLVYFSPANVSPYSFPSGSYFRNWKFIKSGAYVNLTVEACEIGVFEEFEMKTVSDQKGLSYTKSFRFLTSQISTYSNIAYYTPATASPFSFPTGSYFRDWKFTPMGLYTMLTVTASEAGLFDDYSMRLVVESKGKTYSQTFRFLTTQRSTYETPLKYFAVANATPYTFPSDTYFRQWEFSTLGDYTILKVSASQIGLFEEYEMTKTATPQGNLYKQTKRILTSAVSTYTTYLKYFATAVNNAFSFPAGTYLKEWHFTPLGTDTLLTVTAGEIGLFRNHKYDSSNRGNRYIIKKILKDEADKAKHLLPIAYQANASVGEFTNDFPIGTFFYDWNVEKEGDHHVLTVTACDGNYFDSSISRVVFDETTTVKKYYDLSGREKWEPEWWGVRLATKEDAGWKTDKDGIISKTGNRYININGEFCNVNDYIFNNALPCTQNGTIEAPNWVVDGEIGTPNFKKCPYVLSTGECTIESLPLSLIGMDFTTILYVVEYFVTSKGFNSETLTGFIGKNGTFPTKLKPYDDNDGVWLAFNHEYQEYAKASNSGVMHNRIKRVCRHVPTVASNYPTSDVRLTWRVLSTWDW